MSRRRKILLGGLLADEGLIASYPLGSNSNEAIGTTSGVDGSDTDMSYNGTEATFNGTTSLIEINDNDIFSFTDGSLNDEPFTFEFTITPSDVTSTQILIDKTKSANQNREYRVLLAIDKIFMRIHSNGTSDKVDGISIENVIISQENTVKITYDGSNTKEGINITVNGIVGTTYAGTTYIGMKSTSANVILGSQLDEGVTAFLYDGEMKNLEFYNYEKL